MTLSFKSNKGVQINLYSFILTKSESIIYYFITSRQKLFAKSEDTENPSNHYATE
jgi:hypothetical protein